MYIRIGKSVFNTSHIITSSYEPSCGPSGESALVTYVVSHEYPHYYYCEPEEAEAILRDLLECS